MKRDFLDILQKITLVHHTVESESEKFLSQVLLFVTPWTIQSMEFSRPENWRGVAFSFSRGSSQPRDWTQVSHIAGIFFTSWATREAQEY